jgi:hypothetical protein
MLKKGQDNIPKIATPSRHHTLKKQHTKAGSNDMVKDDSSLSPPLLGTTQTELTDERTEMQTTIANMQSTFSTELKKIKAQNKQNNKKVACCIEKSEQEFQKAQEACGIYSRGGTVHPSPRIFCQTRRRSLRHQD